MTAPVPGFSFLFSNLKAFEQTLYALFLIRALNAAALTLLVWDMVLTFDVEVEVFWKARLSVVKVLFLVNRYITPLFMFAHLWTFSGDAFGLSNSSCQVIYSIASVAEVLCMSFVSLIIVLRLYSMYRLSHRTLFIMVGFWLLMILASSGLMIPNIWMHLDSIRYIRKLNICVWKLQPTMWTQWLPKVIDHGLFCLFLFFNAMSTPRSSQTPMLAILYRDGILYYSFTFIILLMTLLSWRFASPIYIGLTAFTTGVIVTMATSRLLLNIKKSETRRSVSVRNTQTLPLSPIIPNQPSADIEAPIHSFLEINTSPNSRMPSISQESLPSQYPQRYVDQTHVKRRAWWLLGSVYDVAETYITVDGVIDDDESTRGRDAIKVTRLGKYGHWL
ncbi:hypothetical protein CPB86DRAFT_420276 [Serendipita vermifera]|nr:hypothetical protein CPB86DRAFT_420276 [Serendipita vermifera]